MCIHGWLDASGLSNQGDLVGQLKPKSVFKPDIMVITTRGIFLSISEVVIVIY